MGLGRNKFLSGNGKASTLLLSLLFREILLLLVKRGRWSSAALKYMIDFIQVITLCDFYVQDHLILLVQNTYQSESAIMTLKSFVE